MSYIELVLTALLQVAHNHNRYVQEDLHPFRQQSHACDPKVLRHTQATSVCMWATFRILSLLPSIWRTIGTTAATKIKSNNMITHTVTMPCISFCETHDIITGRQYEHIYTHAAFQHQEASTAPHHLGKLHTGLVQDYVT